MSRADFRTPFRRWASSLVGIVFIAFGGFALAADEPIDPPGRVGALSEFEGGVQSWSPEDNSWIPAEVNMPVTTGSALWSPENGRAEVRIGSTAVRMAANSQANFTRVDDMNVAIDVAQGTVRARLRSFMIDERFALTAGGIRFEARDAADFRVDTDPHAQRATLHVFSGRVQVLGTDENIILNGGQETDIDFGSQRVLSLSELSHDWFDDWFDARERSTTQAEAMRYVSPEMTGVEALAGQGNWSDDVSYGPIWYPTVAVGWVPYRYGRWAWVSPWGWTWVDDARWGFVTCHYGRWAFVGGRWGWVPGRRIPRPIYAPALVGFYGGGPQASVSIQIGGGPGVGWFPLAPAEVYRPTYVTSATYIRQVNVTHVTNVTVINSPPAYRYARQADAVTIVPRAAFVGARPVNPAMMRVDPDQIRQIPVATRPSLPPPAFRPIAGGQAPRWQAGGQPMPSRDVGRPVVTEAPPPTDKRIPRWPANPQQPGMQRPMQAPPTQANGQPNLTPANPNFAPANPTFAPGNPNFAPANPTFVPVPRPATPPPPPQQRQPGFERPMPIQPAPVTQRPTPPMHNSGDGQEGQFHPPVRQAPAPTNPGGGERPTGYRHDPAVQNPAPQARGNPQAQEQRAPQQEARGQNRGEQHPHNEQVGPGDRRAAQ